MDEFVYAMIKVLSLGAQESVGVVDDSLKKEIIEVSRFLLSSHTLERQAIINLSILMQI